MRETIFNITVNKILKYKWKIIDAEKIKKITKDILDDQYNDNKAYKMIYQMKNKWYLLSLKKDIFYIKNPNQEINEDEVVEKIYWDVLKKHCKKDLYSDRYIWWSKALEINMQNFSINDDISIINRNKQSKEIILTWKSVNFKKFNSNKLDIFKELKKNTIKINFWKNSFLHSNLELSLLETLYNPDIISEKYNQELVKKAIKKYKKIINLETLRNIIRLWKHHTSINRLYRISIMIDNNISNNLKEIIKKESYFIDA